MKLLLLASAGGAIGAGARFLVNEAFAARALTGFPWATLTVNVTGGLLMGIVFVVVNDRLGGSAEWRTFLATGILGGLTTFSAFSLDMMRLMGEDGSALSPRLIAYAGGSVILSFLALLAGVWLARTALG